MCANDHRYPWLENCRSFDAYNTAPQMMTTSHAIAAVLVLVPKHSMSIPDDKTLQLERKTKKVGMLTNLRACMDVTYVNATVSLFDCEWRQVRECA